MDHKAWLITENNASANRIMALSVYLHLQGGVIQI